MAKQLSKQDIVTRKVVKPGHVSQSVDAFTGIDAYDITISGSLTITGSVAINGLSTSSQSNVLTINTASGQLFYTASSALTSTPYKKYVALLNQTGTSAPIATVLENTLGGAITFTRINAGNYEISSSALFTSGKTFIMLSNPNAATATSVYNNLNSIYFDTKDITSLTPFIPNSDDLLDNTAIEIRVYP